MSYIYLVPLQNSIASAGVKSLLQKWGEITPLYVETKRNR